MCIKCMHAWGDIFCLVYKQQFFKPRGNLFFKKVHITRVKVLFQVLCYDSKIIPNLLNSALVCSIGHQGGNFYIFKKFNFFWSSQVPIIQLFGFFADTPMEWNIQILQVGFISIAHNVIPTLAECCIYVKS